MKPNDSPPYISNNINNPKSVFKNIPAAVNHRFSSISANEAVFREAGNFYQAALDKAGLAFGKICVKPYCNDHLEKDYFYSHY